MTPQEELEYQMYTGGIARMKAAIKRAEEAGEAHRNPYAATVFRDFVLPLAELVKAAVSDTKPGRRQAHVSLLQGLDPEAVAFLTVRSVLGCALKHGPVWVRVMGTEVGRTIHRELVLEQIAQAEPDLFHTLSRDFQRRRSKDERHRLTVFKMQAAKSGIKLVEWGIGSREQVGLWLIEQLSVLRMVVLQDPPTTAEGKRLPGRLKGSGDRKLEVELHPLVRETLDQIRGLVEVTSPIYGPCVEPPLDWVSPTDGGFHTDKMRRQHRYLVKAPSAARKRVNARAMPKVLAAVNALQRTAWAVNTKVLDAVRVVAQYRDVGELVLIRERSKPPAPTWLTESVKSVDMDPGELQEFIAWKRAVAEWHTQRKLAAVKYGRFYTATRVAEQFRNGQPIYFVYFADSRGRLYPMTNGLNPQGSDLQKSLLKFHEGKPLLDAEAEAWFMIHGANKWGFDKATLAERAAWHRDKRDLIVSFAEDPLGNKGWQDADSPLQFLAWCFEYAEWAVTPRGVFKSHLPISMDGSCNGLQNFSAMLRDEVGGKATNITASAQMQDIYKQVADVAAANLALAEPDEAGLILKWREQGIERKLVKRSVMTTPYGVTLSAAIRYVIDDYLSREQTVFSKEEHYAAASLIMTKFIWPAIGQVVVKAREAMAWLRQCARGIIAMQPADAEGVISWETPSGFLATQSYYEMESHRIRTRLHGETMIKVDVEGDTIDFNRHANGLAPNFVHSMDAAHLQLVASSARGCGIDALAMIHDDYGTHAADASKLFMLIRVAFLDMYTEHDPIQAFYERYKECNIPLPPAKGSLDLTEVIHSDYFFS